MIALAYLFEFIGVVLGLAGIAGGVLLVRQELKRAPDGYEDSAGFHAEDKQ